MEPQRKASVPRETGCLDEEGMQPLHVPVQGRKRIQGLEGEVDLCESRLGGPINKTEKRDIHGKSA